jgi:hypothetical protein
MFHEDEGSVDVELLAECGAIAHRLRSLERTWKIDLKDLQRRSLRSYGKPCLQSSQSAAEKLTEIFDKDEQFIVTINDADDPEYVNRLRYLEETVIKIHCQQQELSQKRTIAAPNHKKVQINSNMNYSAASAAKNNNNDLTTSPTGIHELKDDQHQHFESHSSCSGIRDNNKSLMNDDDDKDPNCSSSNNRQHQQLCAGKFTNDDLIILLRELKRKIDFTEKMNWLCKFYSNSLEILSKFIYHRPEAEIYDPKREKFESTDTKGE